MSLRTVAISGASGFLGSNLANYLQKQGFIVKRLSRKKSEDENNIFYDYKTKIIDLEKLKSVDVVIHLAGKNLFHLPITKKGQKEIYDSRILSTEFLAQTLERLNKGPKVFICASAVGIYGDNGSKVMVEGSSLGNDFFANLCRDWESKTFVKNPKVRVVNLRISPVLAKSGGMLKTLLPIAYLGLLGKIGDGQQYMSFISLEDFLRAVLFIIKDSSISGAVNLSSPFSINNKLFTKTLNNAIKRPTFFSIPKWFLKLLFKEQSQMLTASMRVYPEVLIEKGFHFKYPNIVQLLFKI